jgi:ribosome recycling factor
MNGDIVNEIEGRMKKTVEVLRHTLAGIRTGRASPALVEYLSIEAYGTAMPLNQLAGISVPEAKMLLVQPYDAGTLKAIEKAIQNSDLGLNPNNDGRTIRLVLPALTEERRRDLVKQVRHQVEESKVSLRNLRREAVEQVRKLAHDKEISEDDMHRNQDKIQQLIDRYSKELDQIGSDKEAEVMEI